jgi:hypothetical protein
LRVITAVGRVGSGELGWRKLTEAGGENLAFMHANSLWRAQRKIASQNLAPRLLDEKVSVIQEAE